MIEPRSKNTVQKRQVDTARLIGNTALFPGPTECWAVIANASVRPRLADAMERLPFPNQHVRILCAGTRLSTNEP